MSPQRTPTDTGVEVPATHPTRRSPLRLSRRKIEHLSDRILKLFQQDPRIHVAADNDLVVRAIDDAIFENMQVEDEIDAEVEALVQQNRAEISAMEMDVGALRNKIKRELARKRGFVI
jgi:hypothetical protein